MNITIKLILFSVVIFSLNGASLSFGNVSDKNQKELLFKSLYEPGFGVLSRQKMLIKKEVNSQHAKVKQCRYRIIETNPPVYVEAGSLEVEECMKNIFQQEEVIELDAIIYETITTSGIPGGGLLSADECENMGIAGTPWVANHTIVLCKIFNFLKKNRNFKGRNQQQKS